VLSDQQYRTMQIFHSNSKIKGTQKQIYPPGITYIQKLTSLNFKNLHDLSKTLEYFVGVFFHAIIRVGTDLRH